MWESSAAAQTPKHLDLQRNHRRTTAESTSLSKNAEKIGEKTKSEEITEQDPPKNDVIPTGEFQNAAKVLRKTECQKNKESRTDQPNGRIEKPERREGGAKKCHQTAHLPAAERVGPLPHGQTAKQRIDFGGIAEGFRDSGRMNKENATIAATTENRLQPKI